MYTLNCIGSGIVLSYLETVAILAVVGIHDIRTGAMSVKCISVNNSNSILSYS